MNEIFISYTSKDRAWAEKLNNSLSSPYFPVFYDQYGLDAGEKWNDQLHTEIKNSNHLIILWSSESMQKQWVFEERNAFKNKNPHGLIIFICLDKDNEVNAEYQSIKYIMERNLYAGGADNVDDALWQKLVNKIKQSVYKFNGSRPIKRAVFTLTSERVEQLSNIKPHLKETIKDSYGSRFADWKPFGSDTKIENLLDNFLYVDINEKNKQNNTSYYWEDIDWKQITSRLWDESANQLDIFENETKDLPDHQCVLILDPFALNDQLVKERFGWCYDKCHLNPKALIMSLTYSLATHFTSLRSQLRKDAQPFYNQYFNPPFINHANSFASLIDNLEVKRQLQIALRNQNRNDSPTSVYTRTAF